MDLLTKLIGLISHRRKDGEAYVPSTTFSTNLFLHLPGKISVLTIGFKLKLKMQITVSEVLLGI